MRMFWKDQNHVFQVQQVRPIQYVAVVVKVTIWSAPEAVAAEVDAAQKLS